MNTIAINKLSDKSNRPAENYSLVDPAVQSHITGLGSSENRPLSTTCISKHMEQRVATYIHTQVNQRLL